ncbi:scavenger receptor class F member 2-like [Saccostrea echinata]|uniref:scavenger receptor class F member 2-like n=1 Tax=Saccostrea echinata TaxID=191078 RepID=UPI002A827765|nr:scavenger receptor class F member 2-like [Saccostrea echinata]
MDGSIKLLYCLVGLILREKIISAYENIALNKNAWEQYPYNGRPWGADKAVDGRFSDRSASGGQCTISGNKKINATWRVDLGRVLGIHHLTIYLRTDNLPWDSSNDHAARFLGFSVYISNTTNKDRGFLCYKDINFTRATIPNITTIECLKHGRYVIYYNERFPGVTYPVGYSKYAFNELCEFQVYGCPTAGFYGENCTLPCPQNCQERHCNIVDGTCLGCVSGYKGPRCEKQCDGGMFGLNCAQSCGVCLENEHCHYVNGTCLNGCDKGYQGINCTKVCDSGAFGLNCNQSCGVCFGKEQCDYVNGTCLNGCDKGYQGDTCKQECPDGRYGYNCQEICSTCTAIRRCDAILGQCSAIRRSSDSDTNKSLLFLYGVLSSLCLNVGLNICLIFWTCRNKCRGRKRQEKRITQLSSEPLKPHTEKRITQLSSEPLKPHTEKNADDEESVLYEDMDLIYDN